MVTIRMIAERCGCSAATVSKALNGASDVNAETARRIRETAGKMGYTPNAAARALKTSRTNNFGVLFYDSTESGLTHEFFAKILNSFKRRAEDLGYDISFLSNRLGGQDVSYVEHARYRNYDGVVICSGFFNDPRIQELAESGIPLVTIDYSFEGCGSILSDNVQGMQDLVTYIFHQGHRRIAYIYGEDTAVTRNRVASFYRTCKQLGLEIPDEYVVRGAYHSPDNSAELTKKLLALPEPPTCIIYPDDFSYLGGRNVLEKMGLKIPEDISVAGYDGIDLGQNLRPRLTTLQQDAEAMGIAAADELVKTVEEGKLYIPRRIRIPGKLLPGSSVKKL